MTATVIRDFLVSLGYQVNKQSEQSFNDSLKKTAGNAVKLGLAIEAAAAAVTGAVVKMAQGMEQSYYQSKRLGGSVKDINAVGYAISQVGGSAEAAKQSMENIASFMRRLPGGKSYIQKLVGSSVDASNVPAVMGALAKQFANMPFAQAKVRADFLGIDEDTLQAMIRDGGRYYDEYQKLAKRAGVDQQKYAENSKDLMVKVRSLGMSFDLLSQKIGTALIGKAGPYIDKFKNWIDRNFDSITKTVTKVADVVIKLSDTIGTFVTRAMEWYDKLDPKSKNVANTIAAIAGAVWLFNKAFNASPVGIIIALGAALVALYQDYQNWKETGDKGLIDWDKWEPTIQSVTGALETISGWFSTLAGDQDGSINALQIAMAGFATYMATKWASSLLASIGSVKVGWLNLIAAMGAVAAADIYSTYQEGAELQRQVEAGTAKEWLEDRNSKNWGTRLWRGAVNWGYRQFGAEEPYDENMRTKSSSGKGSRSGGGLPPPSAGEKKRIAQMAFDKAIAAGYTPEQAAGIVASIQHESAFNPSARGDGGEAHGLFQHQSPRRRVIKRETGIDMSTASAERQVDAALWEMEHGDPMERKAGRLLRNAKTAAEAGAIVSDYFERPLRKEGASRGATAERLLVELSKGAQAAKKRKETDKLVTDAVASLSTVKPPKDGPFAQDWQTPTTPLLPDSVSNNSNATMNLNVENRFMGSVSEKQVQTGVEKGGRVLLRNMQPAIR